MVGIHYRWDFIGLSTDQKPTPETSEKVVNGSTFYCSDNSKLYVFCDGTWYERKPLGGGGGGGSYVAGNGIDITDDTISVDTTTIQPKLTAGSNVTISDDTISATDTTYSNFVGTDGTAAGTAGLVPAPATTDAGKFLKADGTWDTAGGGGASNCRELTSADYNYPVDNPTTVALWLLEPGFYWWDFTFGDNGGITFTTSQNGSILNGNMRNYSNNVMVTYSAGPSTPGKIIKAFAHSCLMSNSTFGWAPYVPYYINTTTGAVVNFQTDAIPVGRGDLTT